MSTINVSNITDGTTTVGTGYVVNGSAKAWVNFNGTGTIAARDSLNLSSLTDNGTGEYDVNFTNSFSAADYSVSSSSGNNLSFTFVTAPAGTPTASVFDIYVQNSARSLGDVTTVCTSVFGDLA